MNQQETIDRVQAIGRLLTPRKNRCSGSFAMLPDGSDTLKGNHPQACRWCLAGAIEKVADTDNFYRDGAVVVEVVNMLKTLGVYSFDSLVLSWDRSDITEQDRIAKALAEYAPKP